MVMLRQMSKSRYNEIGHEVVSVPVAGIAPDIPPWVMTNNESPRIENLFVRAGKLQARNSLVATYDMTNSPVEDNTGATINPRIPYASLVSLIASRISGQVYPVISQRQEASGVDTGLDPCHCHRIGRQVVTGTTPVVGLTVYVPNFGAFASTIETVPSQRYTNLGSFTYALSYASADLMQYEDGVSTFQTNVLKDNFYTGAAYAVVSGTPRGGIDITTWLNRVWVLGGAHPDNGATTTGVSSRLFFTNPVTELSSDTDWKDPSSGLINQIDIDPDSTDMAVGLAATPIGLIIFRQRSIYVLRGTDPTSWIQRRMTNSIGCVDARSIVEADNGVYFMSTEGLMWTDGTTLKNMSGALQQTLQSYATRWTDLAYGGTGAYFSCALVRGNNLLVTFGHREDSGNGDGFFHTVPELSVLLDLATGAWITLTTSLETGISPLGYGTNLGLSAVTMTNQYIVTAYGNVLNTSVSPSMCDITVGSALVDLDVSNLNVPSPPTDPPTVYPRAVPIAARWTTRTAGLSSGSRMKSQLQRAFVDLALASSSSLADSTVIIEVYRAEGGSAFAGTGVPGDSASLQGNVAHVDIDCHDEIESGASLDLEILGPSSPAWPALPIVPQDVVAEFHGAGLAFQSGADMRDPVN